MQHKPQLFLSYARQDHELAKRLFNDLVNQGVSVWADFKSLRAGERWKHSIEKAIRSSDFFVALLSSNSVSKKGFVQKEIVKALELLEECPADTIFVIPVRLDECEPSHDALNELHRVDMFPSWENGVAEIIKSVEEIATPNLNDNSVGSVGKNSLDIQIHGTKKDYVQVQIILVTTGSSYEMSLPIDAMVNHAIPEIVRQLDVPRELRNGVPITFYLVSKTQDLTLDGNLTFRQNGVKDGEIIGLNIDMLLGG